MVKYFLHCLFSMGAVCGGDSLAFSGAGWGIPVTRVSYIGRGGWGVVRFSDPLPMTSIRSQAGNLSRWGGAAVFLRGGRASLLGQLSVNSQN